MDLHYEVFRSRNRPFEIASVGGAWDKVCLESGNEDLMSYNVVGSRLSDHISGDSTKMFIDVLLQRHFVFQNDGSYQYRCDTPGRKRLFRMSVTMIDAQTALLEHKLTSSEDARLPRQIEFAASSGILRCSICNSLRMNGKWADPFKVEEAVKVKVAYTVCPACRNRPDFRRFASRLGENGGNPSGT